MDVKSIQDLVCPFQQIDQLVYRSPRDSRDERAGTRPDFIPETEPQCDVCDACTVQTPCDCISTCFPEGPVVADFGPLGRGLKAGVGYQKDQRIGQLMGRFVERGTHKDGWAVEALIPGTRRSLCLYTRKEGNEFRLVNHACKPSAKIEVERMSGK
ncbi:hypothetical protein F4778DRAFT_747225 [Xylariomycetidae sp. FL2044]|nr:hypothetical protein F4778DRAFT_747225 [Xylariomycetidae sp. FL2044]